MTPTKPKSQKTIIEIKALGEFIMPKKAKKGRIGFDLAIPEDVVIPAHSRVIIKLNFAINLPKNVEAKIEPRSGFSSKGMEGYGTKFVKKPFLRFFTRKVKVSGLQRFDADVLTGKVDPLYTESVGVIIRNNDEQFTLRKGTRVAQMTLYRTVPAWLEEVEELSCGSSIGGFGSTGTMVQENPVNS